MEQKKYLLTQEGIDNLNQELRNLIDVKRPAVIKQIQEAREQGDLSENADYDAAKTLQSEIEKRISEIQDILNYAEIITDESGNKKKVKVGSKVTIYDMVDKKNFTYEIVGEIEADPDKNKISNLSPLAKAILGKETGTTVEVRGVDNPYHIKIMKVEN